MNEIPFRQLVLRLFLPFACGYFLSYLFRTVNAVIGPRLASELGLGDSALGLLTSTYFLAFGAAQLPLGMLLDRYGPRRVEAGFLLLAALGALVFAQADNATGLAVGRALIGLGVSACLMAAMKAFSQWFPPERHAALTGWIMASGGLGALAASRPLELALGLASWRSIMLALMGLTLLIALLLWKNVPDKPAQAGSEGFAIQLAGVRTVLSSRPFWRYAPISFWFTGGFMALQGLWATRWMAEMEALGRSAIANRLTWMSTAMLGGFLVIGFFSGALVRRGFRLDRMYLLAMMVGTASLTVLSLSPSTGGTLLWPLLAASFSISNLAYSLVAQAFPASLAGRANTALNLAVFSGAFSLQWGIGALSDTLIASGWAIDSAYRLTFLLMLAGQLLSLAWLKYSAAHR